MFLSELFQSLCTHWLLTFADDTRAFQPLSRHIGLIQLLYLKTD